MERLFGIVQLLLAATFAAMAVGTLINMVLIASRPETISVVNTLIGQTLMVVCLFALSRILLRKGRLRLQPKQ